MALAACSAASTGIDELIDDWPAEMMTIFLPLTAGRDAADGSVSVPLYRARRAADSLVLTPVATGTEVRYDDQTHDMVLQGEARLVYGDLVLTADQIRYNRGTGDVTATGSFVLTRGGRRLVADEGTYNLASGTLHVRQLRYGQFPIYLTGETVDGTLDNLVFTHATIFFRENNRYSPSLTADRLVYRRDRIVYSYEVVPPKQELAPGESVTINEAVTDVPKTATAAEIGWKPG